MNAVCHRDYESNSLVQFYQYDDRIEILNPCGLYGKVTKENFPNVNDYRNSIIAEAMKVFDLVNRFSRGVLRVEEELQENGNGKPQFSLDLGTAFVVTEPISQISQTALAWDREHHDWKNEGEDGIVNKVDAPVNKWNSRNKRNSEGENEGEIFSLNHKNVYTAFPYGKN